MKSYIIRIKDHKESELCAEQCLKSSRSVGNEFETLLFDAVTPETLDQELLKHQVHWNYPWDKPELDINSGLIKSPYTTAYPTKRVACFMSHYELWKECASGDQTFLIQEHDSWWIKKLSLDEFNTLSYNIIGINHPQGATRRWQMYHQGIQESIDTRPVVPVPMVDEYQVPQGLAGNSAYIIKPEGAKKLLELTKTFGAWPNDALMCRQLLRGKLGVSKTYYTTIQKQHSTTTL